MVTKVTYSIEGYVQRHEGTVLAGTRTIMELNLVRKDSYGLHS